MVKEMFRLDKFYYVDESTLRGHNDYPPFLSLFEFIWCKLSLGFSECNCSYALHIFEFGLLLPSIFDSYFGKYKVSKKIIVDVFISLCFIGFVSFLDASDVINTIYADTPIAMEFAYAVYLIHSKETDGIFGIVNLGLIMLTLIMTKQVAIAFCLLIVFYYLIVNIRQLKNEKVFLCLTTIIVLPLAMYFLWNYLISPYDIVKQFDFSKISLSGMINILNGGSYQFETIKMYVNALFKTLIYKFPIPTTFLSSLLVELLVLELIGKKKNTKESRLFEITCIVGTAGYAVLMFVLYAFCYPKREALQLICYDRYMSSFVSAMMTSILIMIVDAFEKEIEKLDIKNAFILCLLFVVIFDNNRLLDFVPQVILGNRYTNFEKLANEIDKQIEVGSKLFIVYNHDDVDDYPAFMSYFSDETFYTKRNLDLCGEDYSNKQIYEKAIEELKQYDYIYVVNKTESFDKYFSSICETPIESGLYKVDNNSNKLLITKIN